jgi:hypothetical protein
LIHLTTANFINAQQQSQTNMRKIILGLGLMSIINSVFAQQVKYSDVEAGLITKRTEKFDSYISKDGSVYKVGDVIKLGTPSSNKTFAYVQNGSAFVGVTQAPATLSGTKG